MKATADNSKASSRHAVWRDDVLLFLLIASLVCAVIQITMGSAVRVTGSGDGCPDWPTCFGSWIPPLEYHALMEYGHRTIGAITGVVIVAATARAWLRHRNELKLVISISATLALVAAAGLIGGAVVLSELDPGLRTLHLILAESVAATLVFALVSARYASVLEASARVPRAIVALALIAALFTLLALLSGSYAVWRGAGTVCPSWPLCGGAIWPETHLALLHMLHRFLAFVAALVALWAGHAAMRLRFGLESVAAHEIRIAALLVMLCVVAQILLGAANPWTGFEQWSRIAHLAFATLQWTLLTLLFLMLRYPSRRGNAENG